MKYYEILLADKYCVNLIYKNNNVIENLQLCYSLKIICFLSSKFEKSDFVHYQFSFLISESDSTISSFPSSWAI